jgi:hypothetical protein
MYPHSIIGAIDLIDILIRERLQKSLNNAVPPAVVWDRIEKRAGRFESWRRVKSFFSLRKKPGKIVVDASLLRPTDNVNSPAEVPCPC